MSLDVAIIDYGMSNMFSVKFACDHVGIEAKLTNNKDEILKAKGAILPGVGAFGEAMNHLDDLGLVSVLKEFIFTGKPFMGICLGMQLLFTMSEEFGEVEGLNIIPGIVRKFPMIEKGEIVKVPQIGWNSIFQQNSNSSWKFHPLSGVNENAFMYFVHSYYVIPSNKQYILTTTRYAGLEYCSSIVNDNIFASQFHPEKSSVEGLKIYKNFAKTIYQ